MKPEDFALKSSDSLEQIGLLGQFRLTKTIHINVGVITHSDRIIKKQIH